METHYIECTKRRERGEQGETDNLLNFLELHQYCADSFDYPRSKDLMWSDKLNTFV